MPKPRPLGNSAKGIIQDVLDELESNQSQFFDIVLNIHSEEVTEAIQALKEMADRNRVAIKAMQFLANDQNAEANEVLAKFKFERMERPS